MATPIVIPTFIAGIASLTLGIYVLKKNFRDRASRVFFLLMLACSFWSIGEFLLQLTRNETVATIGSKMANVGFVLIPIALLHFSVVYARRSQKESHTQKMTKEVARRSSDEKPMAGMSGRTSKSIYLLYIPPVIIGLLILSTTLFFTVRPVVTPDKIIDADGGLTRYGKLFGEGSGENITHWYFRDYDGDGNYSFGGNGTAPEPFMMEDGNKSIVMVNTTYADFRDNNNNSLAGGKDVQWTSIESASNYEKLYLLEFDWNDEEELFTGNKIYLDNGDGEFEHLPASMNMTDKLVYGTNTGISYTTTGKADYTNDIYRALYKNKDLVHWYFRDLDGNGKYSFSKKGAEPEPIMYMNSNNTIIIFNTSFSKAAGNFSDSNISWIPLKNASNHALIFWLDDSEKGKGIYNDGEDIYLDNGNSKWDPDFIHITWVKTNEPYKNFVYIPGPFYTILVLAFFIYIISTLGFFFKKYLVKRNPIFRKQIKFMIVGLLLIVLMILLGPILPEVLGLAWLPILWDSLLTLVISLFFAVAVLKYKLMDIQLIIKKSLTYSMIVLMIAMLFTVVGESLEFVIGKLLPKVSELLSNIISALIVSISFMPMINYIKKLFNKLFPTLAKYEQEYAARISAYEATFEAMWQDKQITETEKRALTVLRNKLNITDKEHDEIVEKLGIGE